MTDRIAELRAIARNYPGSRPEDISFYTIYKFRRCQHDASTFGETKNAEVQQIEKNKTMATKKKAKKTAAKKSAVKKKKR
jgi:hypothetical protein